MSIFSANAEVNGGRVYLLPRLVLWIVFVLLKLALFILINSFRYFLYELRNISRDFSPEPIMMVRAKDELGRTRIFLWSTSNDRTEG